MSNFFTRPRFQDRDIVQLSGDTISLSGETNIDNIFRFRPNAVTGYVLTALDNSGTVYWALNSSGGSQTFTGNTSGDCITDLYVNNLYGCDVITVWDSVQSIGSSATGITSFAFGVSNSAFGIASHAEGGNTTALGDTSHSEGAYTTASGDSSHSEGYYTTALFDYSHAGGYYSKANGLTSFIHSTNSIVSGNRSVVLGGQNITGTTDDTVYVPYLNIGNVPTGTSVSILGITSGGTVIEASDFYGEICDFCNSNVSSDMLVGSGVTETSWLNTDGSSVDSTSPYSCTQWCYYRNGDYVGTTTDYETALKYQESGYTLRCCDSNSSDGGTNYGISVSGLTTTTGGTIPVVITGLTRPYIVKNAKKIYFNNVYNSDILSSNQVSLVDSTLSLIELSTLSSIRNSFNSTIYSSYLSSILSSENGFITGSGNANIIGSQYSILSGVTGSTIIGGNNITGTTNDTVYVPNLTVYDNVQSFGSSATGTTSFAFGNNVKAHGNFSHAEGYLTTASGIYSHAEGSYTTASGFRSHAEGNQTTASGLYCSHSEGAYTLALGTGSHAEGWGTTASGDYSHTEGRETIALGNYSHTEGSGTTAIGDYSHVHGFGSVASGITSHAEGYYTTALGNYSHTEGGGTTASGDFGAHAEGNNTIASGDTSHSEGEQTTAIGQYSHAEGFLTTAIGQSSHAEGGETTASGYWSHSEGLLTTASGYASHAEGQYSKAIGSDSHAEGYLTKAIGTDSHSGGFNSTALGDTSFIHSKNSLVSGDRSVVIGGQNITGTTDDTVYVPYLNISLLGTGTSINNLGIDSNGFVVTGTTSGGGISINPYYTEPSNTTITWDVSGNSTNYQTTLTANTTLNLTNVRNGDYGTLIATQDAVGSKTITFGTVNGGSITHRVVNGGGGSPTLTSNANAIDILTFTYNGSSMYWTVGNDYT
jgi:hypothetical protein